MTAVLSQYFSDSVIAPFHRLVQRRFAIIVFGIDISPVRQQRFSYRVVIGYGRPVQRCKPHKVPGVDIGSMRHKQFRYPLECIRTGQAAVADDLPVGVENFLPHPAPIAMVYSVAVHDPACCSLMQRRITIVRPGVNRGPTTQEQLNYSGVSQKRSYV